MSQLVDIMKKRHNTQFFSSEIPDKKVIDDILKTAHNLTPHKNNFYRYKINVWGPEHKEQKRWVGISSVGGEGKDKFRDNLDREKFNELSKIFDKWMSKENAWKGYPKVEGCNFNTQVLAPYLLVYTHQPDFKTKSQLDSQYNKSGDLKKIFKDKKSNPQDMDWIIQASMHCITTAYLCAEKGLNASFCRCFFYDELMPTDILLKSIKPKKEITFLLGIGYEDKTQHRHISYVKEPDYDEIVEWK